MIVKQLSILHFKNIKQADLTFSDKINCFFGNNGMGKTNLLDALYYLSFCKNHTHLPDSMLISHAEDFCVLQGFYQLGESLDEIYCGIRRKQRKIIKRNKKEYERFSEHIGLLPLVLISPADTDLIQGGSEERRKFVDLVISQYDKAYLNALIRYGKALQQRNSILREYGKKGDLALFELWEEQMVINGQEIHEKRKRFIAEFLPVFELFHCTICNGEEFVGLGYDSQLENRDFKGLLEHGREKDIVLGYTGSGVHKDDFNFSLGGHLIRKIGSQGQNKTYLIALKLAQFSFLSKAGSSTPILLLDDVFDKLDADRVEQIIQFVAQPQFGQLFITDTNRKYLDEILLKVDQDYKLFHVENGEIEEMRVDL